MRLRCIDLGARGELGLGTGMETAGTGRPISRKARSSTWTLHAGRSRRGLSCSRDRRRERAETWMRECQRWRNWGHEGAELEQQHHLLVPGEKLPDMTTARGYHEPTLGYRMDHTAMTTAPATKAAVQGEVGAAVQAEVTAPNSVSRPTRASSGWQITCSLSLIEEFFVLGCLC